MAASKEGIARARRIATGEKEKSAWKHSVNTLGNNVHTCDIDGSVIRLTELKKDGTYRLEGDIIGIGEILVGPIHADALEAAKNQALIRFSTGLSEKAKRLNTLAGELQKLIQK